MPVAVGFGVRDAATAASIAGTADGVVVGSAIVEALRNALVEGEAGEDTVAAVTRLVAEIAGGVRAAARPAG